MRKFFRYLLMMIADPKKLAEAVNGVSSSAELDKFVLIEVTRHGKRKQKP